MMCVLRFTLEIFVESSSPQLLGSNWKSELMKRFSSIIAFLLLFVTALGAQQDWIRTGTGLGVERVRLAVPDFKSTGAGAQAAPLLKVFNDTLWYDLDHSGIFDF